jgi:glycosyltransferase involved in cell wall biosynthesis
MQAFQRASAAAQGSSPLRETDAVETAADRLSLVALMRHQPSLVVAGGAHCAVLTALLYRWFRRESRLLVWYERKPAAWRLAHALALQFADGVLVRNESDEAAAVAARRSGSMVFNVPGPYKIAGFCAMEPARRGDAAHRIIVSGALTPGSDALTILHVAAHWAEQHPERRMALSWIGNGDLRHVLAAQSLPDNVTQDFPGELADAGRQDEFARSGIFISTAASADAKTREDLRIAEAMASGLIVLFDRGSRGAARLVQDQVSGIGFDAGQPASLMHAIARVMDAAESALDPMRRAARMRILPMDPQGFAEQMARAVEAVTRQPARARHRLHHVAEAQ